VSLNMVRAGVVRHPAEWRWCGHDELTGKRTRYTVLDIDRLLQSLDVPSRGALRRVYEPGIESMIERRQLARDAVWTEALAVGDRSFVERAAGETRGRSRFVYRSLDGQSDGWSVREADAPYGAVS
jgi:putative transposase